MPLVNRVFTRPPQTHLFLVPILLIGREFQRNSEIAKTFTPWLSTRQVVELFCPLALIQPLCVLDQETSGQGARFRQLRRTQMVKLF